MFSRVCWKAFFNKPMRSTARTTGAAYGEAVGQPGLTILTTLGTGIGSALIQDGVLIPNSELGHMELDGEVVERADLGGHQSSVFSSLASM